MKNWLLCFVLLFYLNNRSQNIAGVENFLLASQQDQEILVQEYFNPLFNALQISMGEGWVKSAKTHKKLGFDFTFSLSAINVPESDLSFSNQIFNNLSSTSTHSPTIFGSNSNGTYLVEFYPPDSDYSMSTSFEIPNGNNDLLSSGRLILPNLQFSVGIPFKTELIVRYMPETTNKGAKFKSIGLGIKHSISQYFKASKASPFNLSVLANNSRLEGGYNFGVNSQIPGENQSVDLRVSNYGLGLLGSVDLKIVSVYASIMQVYSKSSLNIKGSYELNYETSSEEIGATAFQVEDPISIENNLNFLRKNIGIAFNFAFYNLFIDYSLQEYNSINLGVSLGVR